MAKRFPIPGISSIYAVLILLVYDWYYMQVCGRGLGPILLKTDY
jgi:hypothetical protein